MDNPFEEARDVLLDIQDDLRDLSFDDIFDINIEQYLPSYDDMTQSALPQTPPINPAVVQTNQQAALFDKVEQKLLASGFDVEECIELTGYEDNHVLFHVIRKE